jgi:DNA-binding GntR family transcriptional regulator
MSLVFGNTIEYTVENTGTAMKANLRYIAHQEIKNKIIYFDIKPGHKINESDISAILGISRTPIREALLLLESEKLVECRGKEGFFVRKLSPQNTDHYYKLRDLIEKFAAPLILKNITTPEIKALGANIKEAQKAIDQKNMKRIVFCETQFHQILYTSSRSEVVIEILNLLSDKFHWMRSISLHAPDGAQNSLNGHIAILEALKRQDIVEYQEQLRVHFENAEKKYQLMQGLFL